MGPRRGALRPTNCQRHNPQRHNPQRHNPQRHNPQRHNPQRHNPQRHNPQRHNPQRQNRNPAWPTLASTEEPPIASKTTLAASNTSLAAVGEENSSANSAKGA